MTTLSDALSETMFMAAKAGIVRENKRLTDIAESMQGSGAISHWQPVESIWTYNERDYAMPHVVKNLKCRGADGLDNLVCSEIVWSDVSVHYGGTRFCLDITRKEFLLTGYCESLTGGMVSGEPMYLDADVHESFLQVYGFVLDLESKSVMPFSVKEHLIERLSEEKKICEDPNFMPDQSKAFSSSDPMTRVFEISTSDEQEHVVARTLARVIVCLEFVCCGPRADWDPKNAVEAARVYPRIFIRSNVTLQSIAGQVHLTRPAEVSSQHWGHCNREIKQGFFTDQNIPLEKMRWFPDIHWDHLFSYYDLDPSSDEFTVVDPLADARSVSSEGIELVAYGRKNPLPLEGYETMSISKARRQGAFDNIHMAPTMKSAWRPDAEHIVMAPVCVHDCFHTHWRWGANISDARHIRGWDDRLPYSVAGAPMVPLNQKVKVVADQLPKQSNVNGPTLHYIVSIDRPASPSDGWQILMHHGSAYAYRTSYSWFGAPAGIVNSIFGWAEFYWDLRYFVHNMTGKPVERLCWSMSGDKNDNLKARDKLRDA